MDKNKTEKKLIKHEDFVTKVFVVMSDTVPECAGVHSMGC